MTVDVGLLTPGLPQAVASWHAVQTQLAAATARELQKLWLQVDPFDLDASWARIAPQLLQVVSAGQLAAAGGADAFLAACLGQLGIDPTAVAAVVPASLAGSAADGRSLAGALYSPVVTAKRATVAGLGADQVLQAGLASLVNIGTSQVADVGRQAVGVGMVCRPAVTGYVRAVNSGACARCLILAGRFYRWSAEFARHPRCDCRNVPADEQVADGMVTDPDAYLRDADDAERARLLGPKGAQAYADGANLNQLVNARRGIDGLTPSGKRLTAAELQALRGGRSRGQAVRREVDGQMVTVTSEGTTSRGMYGRLQDDLQAVNQLDSSGRRVNYRQSQKPRLTPEGIYQLAGDDRVKARQLLAQYGYVTD